MQPQGIQAEPEVEGVEDVKVKDAVDGLPVGHEPTDGAEENEEAPLEGAEHLAAGEDSP